MDRQEEIVEAAGRLFWELGYQRTSVEDIAQAVGLSKPSLYHYIDAKSDLLFAIAAKTIRAFNADLEGRLEEDAPARVRLERWVGDHVRRMGRERETVAVLLREARDLDGEARREIQDLSERYVRGVTKLLEAGIADGSFVLSPREVRSTALFILGALNWMYTWYQPDGPLSADDLAGRMSGFFLRGLGWNG